MQTNVIIRMSLELQGMIKDEVLTDQKSKEIVEAFRTRKWNAFKGSKGEYWTSKEEIDYMNKTLDTVIASIRETYNLS